MDFTKLKTDNQPIPLLENLIAWHGVDKVLTAYDAWLYNEDQTFYEANGGVDVETAEDLAKEIADIINVDTEYYVNDEPAIETELCIFLETWSPKLKTGKHTDSEVTKEELTKERFLHKISRLAERLIENLEQETTKKAERLFDSGAIEPSDWEDNYELPMAVFKLILEEQARGYTFVTRRAKEVYNNLKHF